MISNGKFQSIILIIIFGHIQEIPFSPSYFPMPTVIATSFYTLSNNTVTSQCFLHHKRIDKPLLV